MDFQLRTKYRKLLMPGLAAISLSITAITIGLTLTNTKGNFRYLIATRDLAIGAEVTSSDFRVISLPVKLQNYRREIKKPFFLGKSIQKGEFLTNNNEEQTDVNTTVRLDNISAISSNLKVGDSVDIWTFPDQNNAPEISASNATIRKIETQNNLAQITTQIEVAVAPEYLETLLQAMATKVIVVSHLNLE